MTELTGAEFSGKSVEEATTDGLRALGLRAEDASIEVINRGSRGLFGIGSEPAVVRIMAKSAASARPTSSTLVPKIVSEDLKAEGNDVAITPLEPDSGTDDADAADADAADVDAADAGHTEEVLLAATIVEEVTSAAGSGASGSSGSNAESDGVEPDSADANDVDADDVDAEVAAMGVEMLGEMVRLMGFECTVTAAWHDADDITEERHLLLSVHGREASGLIGRRGETLENIQYLLRLMVNQRMHRWMNIIVDIEEYRARRVEHLSHLAARMAQQAVDSGRSQALEPMTPNERRIIHLVLRDDARVFTESTGEGERRKVVIFPQR